MKRGKVYYPDFDDVFVGKFQLEIFFEIFYEEGRWKL
jgi:hypothetical protein